MTTEIVLVNDNDEIIGTSEKLEAHRKGLLHRAVSVFLIRKVDHVKEILIQKRALKKYHSGGLWSNSCCTHIMPGETIMGAAKRASLHELGVSPKLFLSAGFFRYYAEFDNEYTEHEIDHVVVGIADGLTLNPNPDEVDDHKWVNINYLWGRIEANPAEYTAWFKSALQQAAGHLY